MLVAPEGNVVFRHKGLYSSNKTFMSEGSNESKWKGLSVWLAYIDTGVSCRCDGTGPDLIGFPRYIVVLIRLGSSL